VEEVGVASSSGRVQLLSHATPLDILDIEEAHRVDIRLLRSSQRR
jgi:hypothetical protein